jgi:DNA-binding LytR/AlgR family response regulator
MKPLSAVIAEDEQNLRDELRESLAAVWPELVIAAECEDGDQALAALKRHAPDVMFLDIQMPGLTGLEVAKVASGRCHVVFVTAYDRYAVAAFEAGAIDYVMKPFSTGRLQETARRLKARVAEPPANLEGLLQALAKQLNAALDYMRFITAVHRDEIRLITVDEICYFQADNKYTRVVTPERESLIRRPISELADNVDPKVFWQIHRGTIVNINAVSGIVRDIQGHLRVKLKQRKETLPVSERYTHLFRQM